MSVTSSLLFFFFFFFNDTATTEIYTLSLHDALPISRRPGGGAVTAPRDWDAATYSRLAAPMTAMGLEVLDRLEDRKSTRLNSSHANISYAVFCLKKKKKVMLL